MCAAASFWCHTVSVNLSSHELKCPGPAISACAAQDVPFELVQVDLSNKPAWYRSINPQTLVPSLVVNGETVVESIDICR